MTADDFTWLPIKEPVEITHIIVFEDGPQPRDEQGRFRKRRVHHLESIKEDQ